MSISDKGASATEVAKAAAVAGESKVEVKAASADVVEMERETAKEDAKEETKPPPASASESNESAAGPVRNLALLAIANNIESLKVERAACTYFGGESSSRFEESVQLSHSMLTAFFNPILFPVPAQL